MPSSIKVVPEPDGLALPALRGNFGDWTYYSTVVPLPELARRVSFADDIHDNAALSSWIQRSLKGSRAGDIADYLRTQPERFFSSLVIALYGGTPQWVPIKLPAVSRGGPELGSSAQVLGVLHLGGREKLFAVDGQHRLAGMKRFLELEQGDRSNASEDSAAEDLVSILVVAHREDRKIRTRRLFTTLNKTAVPVSKMERIALDENDVMAITARRLVEEHPWFGSPRIAMHHTNNLGREEGVALTTIGNLYDVLRILFLAIGSAKKKDLEYKRPADRELDEYFNLADRYFRDLSIVEPRLAEYFEAGDPATVCSEAKTDQGGSVYFWPIGLALMTEVAVALKAAKGSTWRTWLAALPKQIQEAPFSGLIWSHRNTIEPKGRVLCRDVLLYMCGVGDASGTTLRDRLRQMSGDDQAALPRRVRV